MMLATAPVERKITLPQLPLEADLFGRVLLDHFEGRPGEYYLRRDDNLVERESSAIYFRSWEKMSAHHRCLLNHARGHVLDIGAGAGQHAVVLQERGLDVTAIDASPRAIDICTARGLRDARVMDANALHLPDAAFDTVLLMNNNLGIAGSPDGLRRLLQRLHALVKPGGQILADVVDYTTTHEETHRRYHRRNIARGRYPGSIRLRIEYQGQCGLEFDWLLMKLDDLRQLVGETGWSIARCVQVNDGAVYAIGFTRE